MTEKDESQFLSRWSRRKMEARESAEKPGAEETPAPQEVDAEAIAVREAELQANREAAEAVDLATLNEKSDFSVFMKDGVPAILRRQAMSVLWRSSPVFANVDGLVDYGEDFADPGLVQKTLQSAWQVGRGYLKAEPDTEQDDAEVSSSDISAENSQLPAQSESADRADETEAASSANDDVNVSGDAKTTLPGENAKATVEVAIDPEPQPVPRISLRRRLMLDEGN